MMIEIPAPPPILLSNTKLTLSQLQKLFTLEASLIPWYAYSLGYDMTDGDAWRNPKLFGEPGFSKGYGHPRSCHKIRLARDYNLFKDGQFLQETEDHRPVGEWWKSRSPYHTWGGDFNDGNHYSFTIDGMK